MQAVSACLAASGGSQLLIIGAMTGLRGCDQRGHVEAVLTGARPPRLSVAPQRPLSRLMGATPTRLAILAIEAESGSSAIRVAGSPCPARHAGQKVGVGLPGGALPDHPVDVAIELRKFDLQEVDMLVDGLQDARLARETTAVFSATIISMTCRRRATSASAWLRRRHTAAAMASAK